MEIQVTEAPSLAISKKETARFRCAGDDSLSSVGQTGEEGKPTWGRGREKKIEKERSDKGNLFATAGEAARGTT